MNESAQVVYPSIIALPDGCDAARLAQVLSDTGAIDAPSARLALARQTPLILGCFDPQRSAALVAAVRTVGGDAFAPTMADIARLGPTMNVRDLRIVDGNLDVDIRNGLSTTVRREHVKVLVRATIRSDDERERAKRVAGRVVDEVNRKTRFQGINFLGARLAARQMHREAQAAPARVTELLDIHTAGNSVFQIDGRRFAFNALGEMKGHGDKANMDRLCQLLSHISPDEVVDEFFPLFRPPPQHQRLTACVPEMRRSGEDAAFAFYSRWTALVYRHVLGVG